MKREFNCQDCSLLRRGGESSSWYVGMRSLWGRSPLAVVLSDNNLIMFKTLPVQFLCKPVHFGPNNYFSSKTKFIGQDLSIMASDAQVPRNILPWCHWKSHLYIPCIIAETIVFPTIFLQFLGNSHRITAEPHHECKVPVLPAEWKHTLLPAERT